MILQSSLRAAYELQESVRALASHPDLVAMEMARQDFESEILAAQAALEESAAYRRFAAARNRAIGGMASLPVPAKAAELEAARAELGKQLESLKKLYRVDPEVQKGPLSLRVTSSNAVSWQKVLDALRALPEVAKLLARLPAALALLAQANAPDPKAPFVTAKITAFEVILK